MMTSDLLDALCSCFDDERERQENVLELTRAQGRAARAYDLEALEAKTQALNLLIQEAVDAETTRMRLVEALVQAYKLPLERQTLSGLIQAAPDPWARRMREFQQRMREIMRDSRNAARENREHIRRGLRVVNEALECIVRTLSVTETAYTARGVEISARGIAAGLLDKQG